MTTSATQRLHQLYGAQHHPASHQPSKKKTIKKRQSCSDRYRRVPSTLVLIRYLALHVYTLLFNARSISCTIRTSRRFRGSFAALELVRQPQAPPADLVAPVAAGSPRKPGFDPQQRQRSALGQSLPPPRAARLHCRYVSHLRYRRNTAADCVHTKRQGKAGRGRVRKR